MLAGVSIAQTEIEKSESAFGQETNFEAKPIGQGEIVAKVNPQKPKSKKKKGKGKKHKKRKPNKKKGGKKR